MLKWLTLNDNFFGNNYGLVAETLTLFVSPKKQGMPLGQMPQDFELAEVLFVTTRDKINNENHFVSSHRKNTVRIWNLFFVCPLCTVQFT